MRQIVKKVMEGIGRAVFPVDIYCICCGSVIDSTRMYSLCDSCIVKFQWAGEGLCRKCGKLLGTNWTHDICYDCRTIRHYFDKGYTCCQYDLYARAVVMDLKYRDKSYIGRIIGDIMADRMESELDNYDMPEKKYDLVIPVPVSKERMKERGYNQAGLIASRFAERMGIPYDETVLIRSSKTVAMKDLNAMQRRLNIKGAFEVTERGKKLIRAELKMGEYDKDGQAKSLMLIDDIYTTGATLDECARVLKEAGAERVDVLTFAAGRNYIPQK